MRGYIRTNITAWLGCECFLIPTISINKWAKRFEINFYILWFTVYTNISYIKEDKYEP